jgi:hypothetical protein
LLSRTAFGPPVRPPQPAGLWTKVGGARVDYVVSPPGERHRRGVYVVWKRANPYPGLMTFDAVPRLTCTVSRNRSNTPLQALTLLNDPVYVEAALALARRAVDEVPHGDVDGRIRHAVRLCLARPPRDAEVRILRDLFDRQRAAGRDDPDKAKALVGDAPRPPGCRPDEFAAWYAVASALLNLDETITKE